MAPPSVENSNVASTVNIPEADIGVSSRSAMPTTGTLEDSTSMQVGPGGAKPSMWPTKR